MKLLSFPHTAYLVTKASHELYAGVTSATLTLTGSLPSVSFRVAVTLSSVTGHPDCTGSVSVGSETLTFTSAGKKTTTTALSALPTITTSGLDCDILIEAITTGGAPVFVETLTTLKIRFEPTTKAFVNAVGIWTQSSAYCMVVNSTIQIGDVIRYNSADYPVRQIEALNWLDGTEIYRILYF